MSIDEGLKDEETKIFPIPKRCDIQGNYIKSIDIKEGLPKIMLAKEICINFGCGGINGTCSYFQELNEE